MIFAIVTFAILWNSILVCRIQYRRNPDITKLTYKPYLFALYFLLIQFVESITLMVQMEISKKQDVELVMERIFSRWTVPLLCSKFLLFYSFTMTQTFEY